MAQTIAAQRGTTTNASDGFTKTTLFTQSTGTATRVILNGVSAQSAGGTSATFRISLVINVNGSGSFIPVAIKGNGSAGRSVYGLSMMPDSRNEAMTSVGGSAGSFYPNRWIPATVSQPVYFGTEIQNNRWEWFGPNGSYSTAVNEGIDYVPSQFWMNSGDTLSIITFNTNSRSADVVYSFTTITES